ncbi:hypothetical protein MLD38_026925 [Melastoma candidum]|uniref:Uncharacterized protein n=1 Tax=Melastoma candidum TaxID=119954 RepID=A0ACB9NZY2_9MYRT|nr:hypothetical protein MLD38_026925 [Melastoma candidum]
MADRVLQISKRSACKKNKLSSPDANKPSPGMSDSSASPSPSPQMPGEKLGGRVRMRDRIGNSIRSSTFWGCTSSHGTRNTGLVHGSDGPVPVLSKVRQKKRAFLCGVSYRKKKYELKGTINDVKNMKQLLINGFAFSEGSIHILTEDEKDEGRRPTRKNILESLKWLVKDSAPGDSLLFFFSGHGLRYPESEKGDELDGFDESICPVDFVREGVIRDNEINSIIVEPLKEGVMLHAIIDACHSGTVLDLPYEYDYNNDKWLDVGPPSGTYKGTRGGIAICLSACPDAELAADTSALAGRKMSGAMTTSFINSLNRQPSLTYRDLLNSMNKVIDEANQSNCLNAPGLSRVFNAKLSQEPVLSASGTFNVRKKFEL